MNIAAIVHRPTLDYIYPINRTKLSIRIQTASKDMKSIKLVWWFRNDDSSNCLRYVPMELKYNDGYCDYYYQTIDTKEIAAYVRYYFLLDDGENKISIGSKGITQNEPEMNENFFEFLWPNVTDGYNNPDWSNELVYYQIFPERYKNGDEKITPENSVAWGSKPSRENFMGGDIKGIIESLDYIKELGANCLYLTPIFMAPSNHKYDTVDYYNINTSFGNKDDLRKLIDEAHKRNMKILLDGVFNHSGYYWPIFQDVVKNNENSIYKNWFYIQSYPVSLEKQNYDCVGHYKWMPKINLENPETAEYFVDVGKYWIKEFGIDGWRLDVADEIPISFWHKFRSGIKSIKKDALLLGETWGDAGKLINSSRLDTAMNYLFKDAVVDWVSKKKIKAKEFSNRINKMLSLYPEEVSLRMYNPLDSHDTSRFIHECNYDLDKFKLGVALQMTLPGCPAIFYGDEIGLGGDNDPDCRACMEWDETKQNREIYLWYKKLIAFRKNMPALQKGNYHTVAYDDLNNVFAFSRSIRDEKIIVIISAGDKECNIEIPIEEKGFDVVFGESYITENAYSISVKIAANSVYILKKGEK